MQKEETMRRLTGVLFIIAIISTFLSTSLALADGDSSSTVGQAVSQEDAQAMREQMAIMAKSLGLKVTDPDGNEVTASATDMAQVADKALDMANQRIDQLIDGTSTLVGQLSVVMKNVAPEIWRIMITQQYVKAVADLALPLALLGVSALFCYLVTQKFIKKEDHEDNNAETARLLIGWWIPVFVGLVFAMWSAIAFSNSVKYVINPEYYAVRDIMVLISNPESLIEGDGGTAQQSRK
ncbi:MAG: hypothetical protein UU08_C0005G0018 [Candidatus Uhrbacteria bacterium GW2011_GWE2_40_58]|nr:MAG: hypothetical protein UT94_C0005G0018 [Candidatus Uhrbacteria bacterium GW2011_GWF2_40_263]KKR67968.1 MAG: hypothetical protein UU08_C0005G0018 [Candidatus Uhrbacteria bacterium GW2011_GWE2_40_58]